MGKVEKSKYWTMLCVKLTNITNTVHRDSYVCTAFFLVLQNVRLVSHLCIQCHCGGPALPDERETTLGLFDSLQHLAYQRLST